MEERHGIFVGEGDAWRQINEQQLAGRRRGGEGRRGRVGNGAKGNILRLLLPLFFQLLKKTRFLPVLVLGGWLGPVGLVWWGCVRAVTGRERVAVATGRQRERKGGSAVRCGGLAGVIACPNQQVLGSGGGWIRLGFAALLALPPSPSLSLAGGAVGRPTGGRPGTVVANGPGQRSRWAVCAASLSHFGLSCSHKKNVAEFCLHALLSSYRKIEKIKL